MKTLLLTTLLCLGLVDAFSQDSYVYHNQLDPAIEAFAPKCLGRFDEVRDITFSRDGEYAYFTVENTQEKVANIYSTHKLGPVWTPPKPVNFNSDYRDLEPFISPDGQRMYFSSNRPDGEEKTGNDYDIWYVEKIDLGWSDPVRLPSPINTSANEFYPSVCNAGHLYFTAERPECVGKEDILKAEWKVDHFEAPTPLKGAINTAGYEFNAYIAPDESFIVFSGYQYEEGLGSGDLFYSFRQQDGSWSIPMHLNSPINSEGLEYSPYVDPTREQMYFPRKDDTGSKVYTTNFAYLMEMLR